MRTRRNLKQTQDKLEELLETSKHHLEDQVSQFDALRSLKAKTKMILKHISKKEEKEFKDLTKQIKLLRDDLNCVFEWHDGILVESMQNGGLLLIDEISLANDSVLERLNSVFEQDRTLVVTEKSSQKAVKYFVDKNLQCWHDESIWRLLQEGIVACSSKQNNRDLGGFILPTA